MSNSTTTQKKPESEQPQQQKPQVLEEDDEFEDFPVEGRSTWHTADTSIISTINNQEAFHWTYTSQFQNIHNEP